MNMVRDSAHMIVPVIVYFGLVLGIMVPVARRGANARRWWILLLLPVCGALGGLVAHLLDAGRGSVLLPMVTGVWYGVIHALYLHWSWRRDARRARPAAA